jgi:hypothetical protein
VQDWRTGVRCVFCVYREIGTGATSVGYPRGRYGSAGRGISSCVPTLLVRFFVCLTKAQLANILGIIYGPTMFAAKFSILLQLKRIFCGARQKDSVWWILTSLIPVVAVFYTTSFFLFLFQCWPRAKIGNPSIEGVCIGAYPAMLTGGIVNLVTDVGILVAPMFAIWRLQVPIKRKLGVASVFGVGLL